MAFIIPNATDTGTGNRFGLLDQAEPDSLDFEILGNVSHSGVLSGGAVTANVNGTSVDVASGSIVLNGVPYTFTGGNFSPTAATDRRFDLIVARLSGGSVSIVVVQGNDSPTNPEYPPSTSVLPIGTTFNGAIHIDLATDVVLAAVLRVSGITITSASIVDKRVFINSGVYRQGTSTPSGGITGSLYYKTDVAAGATGSGLYVKNSSGAWVEAAQNADNNVTNSRLRDSAGLSVIGRSADTTGDPADITASTDGTVLRRDGTALGFGQVATAGLADNAVDGTKLRDSSALSVIGNGTNSSADPTDLVASTDGHVLRRSGITLGFGQVGTAGIADNAVTNDKFANDSVTDSKLRNSAGLSVIGRSGNSSGDPADIVASTDGHVLRRSGTSLGFGQITASGVTKGAFETGSIYKVATVGVNAGSVTNLPGTDFYGLTLTEISDPDNLLSLSTVSSYNFDGTSATQITYANDFVCYAKLLSGSITSNPMLAGSIGMPGGLGITGYGNTSIGMTALSSRTPYIVHLRNQSGGPLSFTWSACSFSLYLVFK